MYKNLKKQQKFEKKRRAVNLSQFQRHFLLILAEFYALTHFYSFLNRLLAYIFNFDF